MADTELSGTIVRDDTEKRHWKVTSPTGFDTEAEAEAVVKKFLNITDTVAARAASKAGGSQIMAVKIMGIEWPMAYTVEAQKKIEEHFGGRIGEKKRSRRFLTLRMWHN